MGPARSADDVSCCSAVQATTSRYSRWLANGASRSRSSTRTRCRMTRVSETRNQIYSPYLCVSSHSAARPELAARSLLPVFPGCCVERVRMRAETGRVETLRTDRARRGRGEAAAVVTSAERSQRRAALEAGG
jgi:hypothetical protein